MGQLTLSVTKTSAAVNLTTVGVLDWSQWGATSVTTRSDSKSGAGSLPNPTLFGAGACFFFSGDPRTLNWTDGTTTPTSSSSNGIYNNGATSGSGWQMVLPADTNVRTVFVYVGGFSLTTAATITASLSDGSASSQTDSTTLTGAASTSIDGVVRLDYQANSSGQSLTLQWYINSSTGNVTLQGAAFASSSAGGSTINTKSISETSAFLDASAKFSLRARGVSEALSLNDLRNAFALRFRAQVDALATADQRALIRQKAVIESFSPVDTLNQFALRFRTATEAMLIVDVLAGIKSGTGIINSKTIIDAAAIIDSLLTARQLTRLESESFTTVDVLAQRALRQKQMSDSMLVTDGETPFVFRNRSQTDPLTLADFEQQFTLRNRSLADSITIIDLLTKVTTGGTVINTKAQTDLIVLVDQLISVRRYARAFGEQMSVSDSLSAFKSGLTLKAIAEAINVGDATAESVYRSRLLTDTTAIIDQIFASKGKFPTIVETLAMTDASAKFVTRARTVAENLSANDFLTRVSLLQRVMPEMIDIVASQVGLYVPYIDIRVLFDPIIRIGTEQTIRIGSEFP